MIRSAVKLGKFFAPSKKFICTSNKLHFRETDEPNENERFQDTSSEPTYKREKCVNEITLIGRIGADPQVLTSAKGNTFVRFHMATQLNSGSESFTDWHNIVAFGEGISNYVNNAVGKGDRVYVKGRLSYTTVPNPLDSSSNRDETTKNIKRASIILQEVIVLKRKAERKTFSDEF